MSFSIKAKCQHGELIHRRKTAEAALKKAREMSRTGCYDIYITTPQGRDYHSSEFAELPRTPTSATRSEIASNSQAGYAVTCRVDDCRILWLARCDEEPIAG